MKNKAIIITICILLISKLTIAQTQHNLKPNSICKFVKGKKNMEGMTACNACAEQRKKNEEALAIEFKKRIAEGKKQEAENLKKIQQDYVKRSAELKQKIETQSKNVASFALPKTENKVIKKEEPKKDVLQKKQNKATVKNPNVLYNSEESFNSTETDYSKNKLTNSKGEVVIDIGNLYAKVIGASLKDSFLNFPENCAIVQFKDLSFDIVDRNGNRMLNDNNITKIYHFYDNLFVVGYKYDKRYAKWDSFDKLAIYNIKTKTFLWINEYKDGFEKHKINLKDLGYVESNLRLHRKDYDDFAREKGFDKYLIISTLLNNTENSAFYYIENNTLKKVYGGYSYEVKKIVEID